MRYFTGAIIFFVIFLIMIGGKALMAQKADSTNPNKRSTAEQLARVGILRFTDLTGTKNFGYMPSSLADAIDTSLQQKFEYIRVDAKKLEEIAAKQRKSQIAFTREEVKATAKLSQTDLLIFGYFTFDQKNNELLIQTDIYVEAVDRLINLPEVRNTVDDSIFSAVDRVAQNIVAAMAALAAEASRSSQGESKKEKEEKAKITKESIAEERKPAVRDWGKKNWLIGVTSGAAFPLGDFGNLLSNSWSNPQFWANYRVYQNYTVGLELRGVFHGFEHRYRRNQQVNIDFILFGVTLGRNFYFHPHFMVATELIGGYYTANLMDRIYQNPYFSFEASGRYLFISWLGAEFKTGYTYIYDYPVSLSQIDVALGLVFTF